VVAPKGKAGEVVREVTQDLQVDMEEPDLKKCGHDRQTLVNGPEILVVANLDKR